MTDKNEAANKAARNYLATEIEAGRGGDVESS